MNLTGEQIRNAASTGVRLLTTEGLVNVPSSIAITSDVQILFLLLRSISNGELVVAAPKPPKSKRGVKKDAVDKTE